MTFYDWLLRLYPASFRNEYGDEMRPLFARRLQQASGAAVASVWLSTIGEVIVNAAGAHVDILKQDLSYTVRSARRAPGFAITAILLLTLGIGATTAAFSVTDFVLIRPLPFREPDRLVMLLETTPGYAGMELSAPNYRDWKAAATSFDSLAVYGTIAVTMTGGPEPRRLSGTAASVDLLPTLGITPIVGRSFTADDERQAAPGVVLLSYRLWQTEFGGDADIVGRTLVFDNTPFTVVGVMPREFHFPGPDALFWVPKRFTELDYQDSQRTNNMYYAVGRLKSGVPIERAQTEMSLIAAQLERQHPKENKDTGALVYPLRDEVSQRSRLLLLALSGAAGCVLLIACANLASLLLARALGRRRELAVRSAIGAGRERLIRQLTTESLVLALVGGGLGIVVAVAAVPLLAQLVPAGLPIASTPTVDLRVLAVAAALTVVTGIVFGMAPVLRASGSPDLDGLREGSRAGGGQKERLRSALVIAEIAASIVLLVSAGLLIRALLTVQGVDPGFHAEGVLTLRTELPLPDYRRVVTREAYYTRVVQEARALPGVTSAAFISFMPMSTFRGGMWPVSVKGDADEASGVRTANNVAAIRYVTPGLFKTLGTPLTRGRDIAEGDTADRPFVAVVSESFVKRYFPDQDPIGRHFTFAFADREVVGVAADVRFRGLERTSEPQVYLSSQQVSDGAITFYAPKALAIRTTGDPAKLAPAVRDIIRRIDPKLPITDLQTLTDMVDLETASRAVQVRVLAAFAAIAFVLAAVGIHGLLSFAVSQRTAEIGVRMALGAQRRDILSMVLSRGVMLAAAGVVPGVFLAYAAGRSMEAILAGVHPADVVTLASAVGLSVLMTLLGTLAPTLRAVRINPITALRAE
ncbi:MAG TPA: ABC transporter permease [Vicinamibacterales bacterium]|nr:ABC transporter permease [Vicinamibacterales bacterium]